MQTFIVDAFTDAPFRGNPAGVCIVESPLSDATMQCIAQELNHSETAFVHPADENAGFPIRFFSPKMEIPLCGHATLASAKVMATEYGCAEARFITKGKVTLATHEVEGSITMEFPSYDTQPCDVPPALLAALGVGQAENAAYNAETKIVLLEITDTQLLASLRPDFEALYRSHEGINGVVVTAATEGGEYDFHSRYFWPWSGGNEDPVTGGTHTFLTRYWATRLGKTRMRSFQSSSRTGFMDLELIDDKLLMTGRAVIVVAGQLMLAEAAES